MKIPDAAVHLPERPTDCKTREAAYQTMTQKSHKLVLPITKGTLE